MKNFLKKLNACNEAITWVKNRTIEQIIKDCHRGDWLLWLAKKIDIDLQILTLAKARCAKTVIHLMKDKRSINAILIAEKFGLGNCSIEELDAAAVAAYAAYADAAAADAAAAAAADAAAADAAADDAADAAAAAAAAADAAAAAAAADADAAAAKIKSQLETADICREILGEEIIKIINQKLKS